VDWRASKQWCRERGTIILPDSFLRAGGVTVSYFEWIKNLSHIGFGRLDRLHEEIRGQNTIDTIEHTVGKSIPEEFRKKLSYGANELDLVRCGLDDTMRTA